MKLGQKVLVTTMHRGVFFGTLTKDDGTRVTLENARNCVYWPTEQKGFLGLAARGPLEGSRIGPAALLLDLRDVTSVALCSKEAAERWEAGPWAS